MKSIRITAIVLSAVLVFSCASCGNSAGGGTDAGTQGTEQTGAADTDTKTGANTVSQTGETDNQSAAGTAESAEAGGNASADADKTDEISFDVLIKRMETEDKFTPPDDGDDNGSMEPVPYGYVCYPEFRVPDALKKSYPALAKTLNSLSMEYYERAVKTLAEEAQMGSEMAQYRDSFFGSNEENWEPYFYRADDNIVSYMVSEESWYNGPHPFTDFSCVAIDPKSGERIPFSDIFTDMFKVPELIYDHLENIDGEYEFTEEDRNSIYPTIENMVADGDITWALGEDGLHIQFNAYELMYYAFGPISSFISYDELGDLLAPAYALPAQMPKTALDVRITKKDDTEKNVEKWPLDKILRYYEPDEPYDADVEESKDFYISCPDWNERPYAAPGVTDPIGESLITLEEKDKTVSDWLDQGAWSAETGIPFALSFRTAENDTYDDGTYTYYTDNRDYTSLILEVRESTSEVLVGRYDFSDFMTTPTPGNEFTELEIPYAQLVDGVLYTEISHRTYSADQPCNAFIVAVNAYDGSLLWRSDMLVANANNFLVIDDQIVCGYGFTAEDDYVYILSIHNGAVLNHWKVKSGPDQFIRYGDSVYVLTYNTAYRYELSFG